MCLQHNLTDHADCGGLVFGNSQKSEVSKYLENLYFSYPDVLENTFLVVAGVRLRIETSIIQFLFYTHPLTFSLLCYKIDPLCPRGYLRMDEICHYYPECPGRFQIVEFILNGYWHCIVGEGSNIIQSILLQGMLAANPSKSLYPFLTVFLFRPQTYLVNPRITHHPSPHYS